MTQIEKLMSALGCTEQEAVEIIEYDKAIDRGADPFPLSAEQKKAEKQMRQADRKPTVYKFDKRERKANADKAFLIDLFSESLSPHAVDIEIVNAEREIVFHHNGTKYKIVLSAPRS